MEVRPQPTLPQRLWYTPEMVDDREPSLDVPIARYLRQVLGWVRVGW